MIASLPLRASRGSVVASLASTKAFCAPETGTPSFLAINKVDRVRKDLVLPQIAEANRQGPPFREIFPVSAVHGDNVDALLKALATNDALQTLV